ncbi:YlxR family protein [Schaalia canis]|uniref:YlxR family protein n=1 Tax=Schaalia canis TaxID=100469 RepID=UPI00196A7640|nr:YlxR family protein [Schaalia canis]
MRPHHVKNPSTSLAEQGEGEGDAEGHPRVAPQRTCAGCGGKASRNTLIRVVANADLHLVVDSQRALPGRGAWVHPAPECVAGAQQRRALPRLLKLPGAAPVPSEEFWRELALAALSEAPTASTHE